MKQIAPEVIQNIKGMVGLTLIEVNVKFQSVELVFLSGISWVLLQIYKDFSFATPGGRPGTFDPMA